MSVFLEYLRENIQKEPDREILFDELHTKGISYAELDELSGKVYAWVKEQGLGKEDFVMINLPRSVLPVIAMIGIWKAGAAWVMVEDTYAPDRIEFIRNDCGCKAEINNDNWEQIMRLKPLTGGGGRHHLTLTTQPSPSIPPAAPEGPRAYCMSGAASMISAESFARILHRRIVLLCSRL